MHWTIPDGMTRRHFMRHLSRATALAVPAFALTESLRAQAAELRSNRKAAILLWMGRVPICTCGSIKLWHGVVVSSENSQHLSDWYTPSHILHGLVFYGALHLVARRVRIGWRLLVATVVEAAWEVAENTNAVIER